MPLQIGKPAPAFKGTAVVNGDLKQVSLEDFKGSYVVLLFYPADFTFVCPTELIAFSDRLPEFEALNVKVVGVSVDSAFSHLAWVNQPRNKGGLGGLSYPLLSDITKTISHAYEVLCDSGEDAGIAFRGLFIINEQGILRQKTVNDMAVGRSVDETIRLLQAYQFTDVHGEVCPVNWKPGADTIIPDAAGSKAYFTKQV